MPRTLLNLSVSLDGFIADPAGGDAGLHAWLFAGSVPLTAGGTAFKVSSQLSADLFRAFVESLGSFVIGATAFANIGQNPPFGLPTFVVTHHARDEINQGVPIRFVTEGIHVALEAARSAAGATGQISNATGWCWCRSDAAPADPPQAHASQARLKIRFQQHGRFPRMGGNL